MEMAMLRAVNTRLSPSQAARLVAATCPNNILGMPTFERLRKKYRKVAKQIEPEVASAYPFLSIARWIGGDPTRTPIFDD